MSNWEQIMVEAKRLERNFRQKRVDLSEAEKAGYFFISNGYNDPKMERYLKALATDPPVRSKQSKAHYRNIRDIWQGWRTQLSGKDKARAWGWGIRMAKAD